MRVDFYHLTRTPVEKTLPIIAEKVLAAGHRLAVVMADGQMLDRLDEALWTFRPSSFLPHGRRGDQPVLLVQDCAEKGTAGHVAIADGLWPDVLPEAERLYYFFDEAMLQSARAGWRSLSGRDEIEKHYWKQTEQGGWIEGP